MKTKSIFNIQDGDYHIQLLLLIEGDTTHHTWHKVHTKWRQLLEGLGAIWQGK